MKTRKGKRSLEGAITVFVIHLSTGIGSKAGGGSLVYGAVEDRSDICCKKLHPASSSVFRIVAHQSHDPSFSTEKLIYILLIIRSIRVMNKLAIKRDLFIYLFIYREEKKYSERIVNMCEEKYM